MRTPKSPPWATPCRVTVLTRSVAAVRGLAHVTFGRRLMVSSGGAPMRFPRVIGGGLPPWLVGEGHGRDLPIPPACAFIAERGNLRRWLCHRVGGYPRTALEPFRRFF